MRLPDFEGLLAALTDAGFEFVVVGGYSAMLHGSTLMTRDIDVVCPLTPENLHRLWSALGNLNPVHRMDPKSRPLTEEDLARSDWKNLYLRSNLGILDCLGSIEGLGTYADCLPRSTSIPLGKFSVRVLSLDDLITAKRAMGRPRDLHTAEELELIRERATHKPSDSSAPEPE